MADPSSEVKIVPLPNGVHHAVIVYGVAGGIALLLGITGGYNSGLSVLTLPFSIASLLAIIGLYSRHQLGRLFALWIPLIGFFGGGLVFFGYHAGLVISDIIFSLFANHGSLFYYTGFYFFYGLLTLPAIPVLTKSEVKAAYNWRIPKRPVAQRFW